MEPRKPLLDIIKILEAALRLHFGDKARLRSHPLAHLQHLEIEFAMAQVLLKLWRKGIDENLGVEERKARNISNNIHDILSKANKQILKELIECDPRVLEQYRGLRLVFRKFEKPSLLNPFSGVARDPSRDVGNGMGFIWSPPNRLSRNVDLDSEWLMLAFFGIHGGFEIKSRKSNTYHPPRMTDSLNVMITFLGEIEDGIYDPGDGDPLYKLDPKTVEDKIRSKAPQFIKHKKVQIDSEPLHIAVSEGMRLYSARYLQKKRER